MLIVSVIMFAVVIITLFITVITLLVITIFTIFFVMLRLIFGSYCIFLWCVFHNYSRGVENLACCFCDIFMLVIFKTGFNTSSHFVSPAVHMTILLIIFALLTLSNFEF